MVKQKVQCIVYRKNKGVIEYLLLRRIPRLGSIYQPITGSVEPEDKSLKDAALRELKEETSITDILDIKEGVDRFTFTSKVTGEDCEETVFAMQIPTCTDPDFSNNIYEEHDAFVWAEYDEAMVLLHWNKDNLRKVNQELTHS